MCSRCPARNAKQFPKVKSRVSKQFRHVASPKPPLPQIFYLMWSYDFCLISNTISSFSLLRQNLRSNSNYEIDNPSYQLKRAVLYVGNKDEIKNFTFFHKWSCPVSVLTSATNRAKNKFRCSSDISSMSWFSTGTISTQPLAQPHDHLSFIAIL